MKHRIAAIAVTAGLLLTPALAACHGSGHAAAVASSASANPTVQAELDQGKQLVAACFPGTLVQQVHTVHLVFLSSATGKNGPAVIAARDKVFTCLHISDPARRQQFVNDAGEAALHASPKLTTHDGRVKYFEITLPKLVLAAGGTAAGMGTSTVQPSIPGVTQPIPTPPAASASPSVKASS